jgi:hypothetical protein
MSRVGTWQLQDDVQGIHPKLYRGLLEPYSHRPSQSHSCHTEF